MKRVKRVDGVPVTEVGPGGKPRPVTEDVECAWHLIYERLAKMGRLELIKGVQGPKDWSTSRDGGPRRIVREDLLLLDEE